LLVDASTEHEPVAQGATPSTKPWDADTKVTEAGLKPASEAAADVGATDGDVVATLVGAAVEAGGAEKDPLAEATADVAGAGDETVGVDAAETVAGALLPVEFGCVLLEQPAAAISATSVIAPARVVHEVVMF
jgi:hypothetical protein